MIHVVYLSDGLLMLMGFSNPSISSQLETKSRSWVRFGLLFFLPRCYCFSSGSYLSGCPIRDAAFDHLIMVVTGISPLTRLAFRKLSV